jgi:glycosyltransferase involved in cell wall biosynthesis
MVWIFSQIPIPLSCRGSERHPLRECMASDIIRVEMTQSHGLDPVDVPRARHSSGEPVPEPKSVLLITPRWARDGGVGAHVERSAAVLARAGHEVNVLVARDESSEHIDGVTVHQSPELCKPHASLEARLGDILSCSPSVVHLHQVDTPEIVDAIQPSAPVVISAHGYTVCTSGVHYFTAGHECTRPHGLGCWPNLIARGCAHTRDLTSLPSRYRDVTGRLDALRCADLAVSYSSAVDRHLAANGVTRRAVIPYFPTMVAKQGSGHGTRRRVVFAGRVVHPKGVGVLIRAARAVEGEFVVCGDGLQLDAMRRLAHRLGVGERVRFTGWLDADQLANELANASVVVVPSLWPEPFGLVGIEAFAAGRPAVASSTGGIEDWLEDGVSGLTVPPGDAGRLAQALNELLADPERQRQMGEAGRRAVAARFSTAHHLAAILAGYRSARSRWESRRQDDSAKATALATEAAAPC